MADFEVWLDRDDRPACVGRARVNRSRGGETVVFAYDRAWLDDPRAFALEPLLPLGSGDFAPPKGRALFAAIGDSAPDTWGRRLMRRAERRLAEREGRTARTLMESDYLLGVADATRLGALRFRRVGGDTFEAPAATGVPPLVQLERLLRVTERLLRDEESDEDLELLFAPGSSLGSARPKASVIDRHWHLAIAKFPKETDEYSLETWEEVAMRLAERAGIETPHHELVEVGGRRVLLSRRFDRVGSARVPFLSAMAMLGARDGERGSYPEVIDALTRYGAEGAADAERFYSDKLLDVADVHEIVEKSALLLYRSCEKKRIERKIRVEK